MGSNRLGYQVQLDAVNITEVFNVLARERLPSHALAFEYLLSGTDLSSYTGIDRIHETSEKIESAEIKGSRVDYLNSSKRRDGESGVDRGATEPRGDLGTKDRDEFDHGETRKGKFQNKRINK
jgi:hypothetical protein